jgi:hypothetical protein
MFPTEVTVEIQTTEGPVAVYADESLLVEERTGLRATRFSIEKDFAVCLLPVEDVDSRWVRVPTQNVHDLQVA